MQKLTEEQRRLREIQEAGAPWRRWGPYLSERQWARCARTTAPTATHGTTSATIRRAHALTAGGRWTGRLLRRQAKALLRACPVERQERPYSLLRVLFYEHFHGDNGAGLGASHQTGWTGLVAPLLQLVYVDAETLLAQGARTRLSYKSKLSAKATAP
jgi:hypothetical protein